MDLKGSLLLSTGPTCFSRLKKEDSFHGVDSQGRDAQIQRSIHRYLQYKKMLPYPRGICVLLTEGKGSLKPSRNFMHLINPLGLCSRLNFKHALSFRQLHHTHISSFRNHNFTNPGSVTRDTLLKLIQHQTPGGQTPLYTQFHPQQINLLTSSWRCQSTCAALPQQKVRSLRKKDTDSSTKLTDGQGRPG